MDSFHAGWSFFFVAEREAESAVERGPLGSVSGIDETDEAVRVDDGVDACEYWELGDVLPRNNGAVFIPGDI